MFGNHTLEAPYVKATHYLMASYCCSFKYSRLVSVTCVSPFCTNSKSHHVYVNLLTVSLLLIAGASCVVAATDACHKLLNICFVVLSIVSCQCELCCGGVGMC
jgi:hypothetical protein